MLSKMIKKLRAEFGYLEEEVSDVEQSVLNRLDRSVKLDEVDTITFGLETDDGKIVKVYVKADQADDFEKALSTKLGEIDDIEEVLNELAKEYEIVDVEWPTEDVPSDVDDEQDDGSEVMDKKVYDNARERKAQDQELKPNLESLNFGERFVIEHNDPATIQSRFVTATQLMIYHAILELGIPEVALSRNAYRATIVKNIKEKALDLQRNAALKNALKLFINRSIDFEKHAEANREEQEKKGVNESILVEGVSQDFWEMFIKLISYLSSDQEAAKTLLASSQLKQLMTRSSSSLQSKVTSQLRQKLNDLKNAMEGDVDQTQLKLAGVTESTSPDEVTDLIKSMLTLADPSKDGSSAAAVMKSSAWNRFFSSAKGELSQKFSGTLRQKLNMVKSALPGTSAEPTNTSVKGTGTQDVGQPSQQQGQPSTATTESKSEPKNAVLAHSFKYGSETFDAGHPIQVIGEDGDSYIVKPFPIMATGHMKLKKSAVKLTGKINVPVGGPGGEMPGGLNESDEVWTFELNGKNLKIQGRSISVEIDPEAIEHLVKGITNHDAVIVKDQSDPTHKVVFSPRGSSVLVKKVGTATGEVMKSKDVDNLLDTVGRSIESTDDDQSDEVSEAIIDEMTGVKGWYVYLRRTNMVKSGPYPNLLAAKSALKYKQWYQDRPELYGIAYGMHNSDGTFSSAS